MDALSFMRLPSTLPPQATYHEIFNTPGYNQRDGAGCVADYFRDQSDGRFNLQFDVYGPYKTSGSVKTGSSMRTRTYSLSKNRSASCPRKRRRETAP